MGVGVGVAVLPELREQKRVVANFRPKTATAMVRASRWQSARLEWRHLHRRASPTLPLISKKRNLKPNSGVLVYTLMTREGQWEHHHSSVIISLWTINVTCFLRQKDLIEGEHKTVTGVLLKQFGSGHLLSFVPGRKAAVRW